MESAANHSERLLIPLDPPRGFNRAWTDLERIAELDPKVRAATKLLERRFGQYSEAEQQIISTLLWATVRLRLKAGSSVRRHRLWFGDGDNVLRTVETALDTTFSDEVLRDVIRESTQLMASDSGSASEIEQARQEVQRFVAANFGPATVLAFAAGVGLVFLAAEAEAIIHGHEGPDILIHGH